MSSTVTISTEHFRRLEAAELENEVLRQSVVNHSAFREKVVVELEALYQNTSLTLVRETIERIGLMRDLDLREAKRRRANAAEVLACWEKKIARLEEAKA